MKTVFCFSLLGKKLLSIKKNLKGFSFYNKKQNHSVRVLCSFYYYFFLFLEILIVFSFYTQLAVAKSERTMTRVTPKEFYGFHLDSLLLKNIPLFSCGGWYTWSYISYLNPSTFFPLMPKMYKNDITIFYVSYFFDCNRITLTNSLLFFHCLKIFLYFYCF